MNKAPLTDKVPFFINRDIYLHLLHKHQKKAGDLPAGEKVFTLKDIEKIAFRIIKGTIVKVRWYDHPDKKWAREQVSNWVSKTFKDIEL